MYIAQIAQAVQTAFINDAVLMGYVPGGCSFGIPKQIIARPYAILTLKNISRKFTSGNRSTVKYIVDIKVYGQNNASLADSIGSELANLYDFNRCALNFDINTGVISMIPTDEIVRIPIESPVGDDMLIFHNQWHLQLNQLQLTNFISR